MREQFYEEIGLWCGLAGEVVFLEFNEERVKMLRGKDNVIHSACCSRYAESGCVHYGLAAECKSIFKQAERIIENNRVL